MKEGQKPRSRVIVWSEDTTRPGACSTTLAAWQEGHTMGEKGDVMSRGSLACKAALVPREASRPTPQAGRQAEGRQRPLGSLLAERAARQQMRVTGQCAALTAAAAALLTRASPAPALCRGQSDSDPPPSLGAAGRHFGAARAAFWGGRSSLLGAAGATAAALLATPTGCPSKGVPVGRCDKNTRLCRGPGGLPEG